MCGGVGDWGGRGCVPMQEANVVEISEGGMESVSVSVGMGMGWVGVDVKVGVGVMSWIVSGQRGWVSIVCTP